MPQPDLNDVVEKVGNNIHAGQVAPDVGYQAIGAVAAWRAGFPDLTLAGMSDSMVDAVEQALRDSDVDVPWPADLRDTRD